MYRFPKVMLQPENRLGMNITGNSIDFKKTAKISGRHIRKPLVREKYVNAVAVRF